MTTGSFLNAEQEDTHLRGECAKQMPEDVMERGPSLAETLVINGEKWKSSFNQCRPSTRVRSRQECYLESGVTAPRSIAWSASRAGPMAQPSLNAPLS